MYEVEKKGANGRYTKVGSSKDEGRATNILNKQTGTSRMTYTNGRGEKQVVRKMYRK